MIFKRVINKEYVKKMVDVALKDVLDDILEREKAIEQKRIALDNEKNKIITSNSGDIKSILEIKEKAKELEEGMHQHLRVSNSEGDTDYVRAKQKEHTINFINKWLLKR